MKGIILAGGRGTRLAPLTHVTNKHLLPVYDKPMIMFPIETLKHLGISQILIVTGGEHIGRFAEYLGDGSRFGVSLTYRVQEEAKGIAHAMALAEDFVHGERFIAILGDNIYEHEAINMPNTIASHEAVIFGKEVSDPHRFGVMECDEQGAVISIEEKPVEPKSAMVVTGLYMYPPDVFDIIRTLKPSLRGELELTDVNNEYVRRGACKVVVLNGFWSDAGLFKTLFESAEWVKNKRSNK